MATENDITLIKKELTCLKDKMDDIHKALVGDEYDKEKGLVPRLKKVEKYVEVDKRVKWIGGGFAIAIGGGLKSVWDWMSNHI
jgi:hypothetical protein